MSRSAHSQLNPTNVLRYDRSHVPVTTTPAATVTGTRGREALNIHGISSAGRPAANRPEQPVSQTAPAAQVESVPADELEVSATGKLLSSQAPTGGLRAARLAQIQAEIANGSYDTDEKFSAALEKLLGSL